MGVVALFSVSVVLVALIVTGLALWIGELI